MYQFRGDLPSRAEGKSFDVERPPAQATQLAIARCTSGWWYTGYSWSPGLK